MKINVKPLSVNQCWAGRRFKTPEYKKFERQVLLMLPSNIVIPEGKLKITLTWGFSSRGSDFDNPIKPFIDILQKKYDFNDSRIYEAIIKKVIVKKGGGFIDFELINVK